MRVCMLVHACVIVCVYDMCMCACLCVCICVCMCAYMCVYLCTCVIVRVYVCTCVYLCMYVCVHVCVHMCVYVCMCIYICMCSDIVRSETYQGLCPTIDCPGPTIASSIIKSQMILQQMKQKANTFWTCLAVLASISMYVYSMNMFNQSIIKLMYQTIKLTTYKSIRMQ